MKYWYEYPELFDRTILSGFVSEGKSIRKIAREVGCSKSAVESALRNHGFSRPIVRMSEEMKGRLRL